MCSESGKQCTCDQSQRVTISLIGLSLLVNNWVLKFSKLVVTVDIDIYRVVLSKDRTR